MPKPYALSLYSSVLGDNLFERSLTADAQGWKRSKRSQGGSGLGSFSLEGTPTQLYDWFRRWLGYDVRERAGGSLSWRGMVYEMDLTINGVTRRRSFDLMANRVKTTYVTADVIDGNIVENDSFENFTAGVPDDFWTWQETAGPGTIQSAGGGIPRTGASCAALTSGVGGGSLTYMTQQIQVTPGAPYSIRVWLRAAAGSCPADPPGVAPVNGCAVRWGVQDTLLPTHWPVPVYHRYFADDTWWERYETFIGPAGGQITVWLHAPEEAARTVYYDDIEILEHGEGVYQTDWEIIESGASGGPIDKYGCKEEILHLNDYPYATSVAYRDRYLYEHAYPWPHPVAAGLIDEARLDVFVAGYAYTMNWLYVTSGNGDEDNVDVWLASIIGSEQGLDYRHGGTMSDAGDCQFVRTGVLDTNTLQTIMDKNVEQRAWDEILELSSLGDATGMPWRTWVVNQDLTVNYRPVVLTPRYFIRRDGIYDTMAGAIPSNPWLMEPAVFRDMTYRAAATEPGSVLYDAADPSSIQDMYIEEVEMADGWDQPALKTSLFNESDMLLARAERGREVL